MIIYKITNLLNNKVYIGQTIKSIQKRFSVHCINFKGSKSIIRQSILKNGKENFRIELIETCISRDQMNEREIYWISFYNSISPNGYNITVGGGGVSIASSIKATRPKTNVGRKQTLESNIKRSKTLTGQIRTKQQCINISKSLKNKAKSEEHKKNLSISMKGRVAWNKGIKATPSQIEKNRNKSLGKKQSAETVAKRVAKIKGLKRTQEQKDRLSEAQRGKNTWIKGIVRGPLSQERKDNLKRLIICPHCHKIGGHSGMKSHHFNNCKFK